MLKTSGSGLKEKIILGTDFTDGTGWGEGQKIVISNQWSVVRGQEPEDGRQESEGSDIMQIKIVEQHSGEWYIFR